jgi:hypothetical protein
VLIAGQLSSPVAVIVVPEDEEDEEDAEVLEIVVDSEFEVSVLAVCCDMGLLSGGNGVSGSGDVGSVSGGCELGGVGMTGVGSGKFGSGVALPSEPI